MHPGPLGGVCSQQAGDSLVVSHHLPEIHRFPNALLPSRAVCRLLGPAPACLGSRPQPQLRGSNPWAKTCRRRGMAPPGSRVHRTSGREPPPGKRRQPSRLLLQALLGWSRVRLQYRRAPAPLRALIWQSSLREAALPGARLAQTCLGRALPRLAWLLDFLPRKEQSARGWETPLAPSWPQLCSCLAFAPRPQAFLWWLRGRWLPHCQGLQQWELCSREMKGIFGMQSFIRCETHTFTLNPHPEPLPSPSPTPSPWTLTLTLTLKPYPHPHP